MSASLSSIAMAVLMMVGYGEAASIKDGIQSFLLGKGDFKLDPSRIIPGYRGRLGDKIFFNKIVKPSGLKEKTQELLTDIGCSATALAVVTGPAGFIEKIKKHPTHEDLTPASVHLGWQRGTSGKYNDWVQDPKSVPMMHEKVSEGFSTSIPSEDDFFTKYETSEALQGALIRNRVVMPLEDGVIVKNDAEIVEYLEDLKLTDNNGGSLPKTYNNEPQFDMISDASFSRMFFHSMGAPLVMKQTTVSEEEYGPYVVDLDLSALEVREGMKKYYAVVHFDENQIVSAIEAYDRDDKQKQIYLPGSEGWAEAKMIAKVTMLLLLTAREHLTWTHLIVSNDATRESVTNLAPSHPLRRLLAIFTYGTTEVNTAAFDALVPDTSLLHRSTGLKSLKPVFDLSYQTSNAYEPFPERHMNTKLAEAAEQGRFPYRTQGVRYYKAVHAFVTEWQNAAANDLTAADEEQTIYFYNAMKVASEGQKYELKEYTPENLNDLLATIIFTVTAYHEIIGNIIDFAALPSRAGWRLTKESPTLVDVQSFLLTLIATASTSVPMPKLMRSFPNYFGKGGAPEWEVTVWDNFQTSLQQVASEAKEENGKNGITFNYFNPEQFECSVSV